MSAHKYFCFSEQCCDLVNSSHQRSTPGPHHQIYELNSVLEMMRAQSQLLMGNPEFKQSLAAQRKLIQASVNEILRHCHSTFSDKIDQKIESVELMRDIYSMPIVEPEPAAKTIRDAFSRRAFVAPLQRYNMTQALGLGLGPFQELQQLVHDLLSQVTKLQEHLLELQKIGAQRENYLQQIAVQFDASFQKLRTLTATETQLVFETDVESNNSPGHDESRAGTAKRSNLPR